MKVANVSIVIPVFNAEETITRCLHSIFSQTSIPKEIILVDDNSQDNSLKICRSFNSSEIKILVFRNTKNIGAGGTRNVGMLNATMPFIMFCDADDWWEIDKIERQLEFMSRYDLDMSATGVIYRTAGAGVHSKADSSEGTFFSESDIPSILIHNKFATSSLCIKRESIYFLFSDLRNRQDMEFVCMNISACNKAGILAAQVVNYDCSVKGISNNKLKMITFNFRVNLRVLKKLMPAIYCLILCIWLRVLRGLKYSRELRR